MSLWWSFARSLMNYWFDIYGLLWAWLISMENYIKLSAIIGLTKEHILDYILDGRVCQYTAKILKVSRLNEWKDKKYLSVTIQK